MAPAKATFKQQKIPLIQPLLHENKFVTDFKENAEHFNFHFATQPSLISNSRKLPSDIKYLIDNRLSCVAFSHDKIAEGTQSLDPSKAHGQGNTGKRRLKVCSLSICKPLEIIFNQCLENGAFPSEQKKGNVPIHKKGDKQILKSPSSVAATYMREHS